MYSRIYFPQQTDEYVTTTKIEYRGSVTVPTTIPKRTHLYIQMVFRYKLSTSAYPELLITTKNADGVSSNIMSFPFYSGGLTGTGTKTWIHETSTPSTHSIRQNTSMTIEIYESLSGSARFSTSDYIRWIPSNSYMIFGHFTPVVAGELIKSTDFTEIGQTATVGEKITNSNFTSDTIITADKWNAKWG